MSFNNHLAFNVSKSMPTTSTTNTTSVSSSGSNASQTNESSTGTSSNTKSPFLQEMLTASSSERSSPKLVSGPSVSGTAPTVVTYGEDSPNNDGDNSGSGNKKDLIELFDKFDITKENNGEEIEEDKFESFRRLSVNDKGKESDDNSVGGSEVIEEKGHEGDSNITNITTGSGDVGGNVNNVNVNGDTNVDKTNVDNTNVDNTNVDKTNVDNTNVDNTNVDINVDNTNVDDTNVDNTNVDDINVDNTNADNINVDNNTENINTENIPNVIDPTENPTDSATTNPDTPLDNQTDFTTPEEENGPVEQYQLTEEEMKSHQSLPLRPQITSRNRSQVNVKVNPKEQYMQSHKPFDFHIFLQHLKKKSADPVARYIRSFLVSFNRQSSTFTLPQKVKIVHDFKLFMNDKFAIFDPFASMDEIDLENSREGLEKLIMNRIYNHCFPPAIFKGSRYIHESVKDDITADLRFSTQLDKYNWINGHHLDVNLDQLNHLKAPTEDLSFVDYATQEFRKINSYRAPRDKIICLLNACKIIFGFLKVSNQETNADAFIPILIVIIIKSKIQHLISNIHYIENFRGQEWLSHGETSYYLSSVQGAVNFIENISVDDLTVSQQEYDAHIEAWNANQNRNLPQHPPQPNNPVPHHPGQQVSPSSVIFSGAEMFTKSISNFLSPSPQTSPEPNHQQLHQSPQLQQQQPQSQPQQSEENNQQLINETYTSLEEIFPGLDKSIMKDIVIINKGDMDTSLDACLQISSS